MKDTTIAIVSKPIVVIKTLWPQRAIFPSMFKLPVTNLEDTATWERLHFAALLWMQFVTVQPRLM